MKYLINPLKRMFDFQGRATRKEFWLFICWLLGLMFAAWFASIVLCMAIASAMYSDPGSQQAVGWLGVFVCIIGTYLAFVLLPLSLRARRLHDIGVSGWWQLLLLIPQLGDLLMLICMMIPGQVGENRFGPEPKDL
ncbi:DUF805 domain-containing protein [Candidatus Avelusimicrobium facis]|uniref:DUF805 domain-containing protein n=1 Tax=Candidatus Avelusimicrobium facis TaxID=3416203 RepID=UPI003D0FDBD9